MAKTEKENQRKSHNTSDDLSVLMENTVHASLGIGSIVQDQNEKPSLLNLESDEYKELSRWQAQARKLVEQMKQISSGDDFRSLRAFVVEYLGSEGPTSHFLLDDVPWLRTVHLELISLFEIWMSRPPVVGLVLGKPRIQETGKYIGHRPIIFLIRHYGLDNMPSSSQTDLGKEYGLSRTGIRRYLKALMITLRGNTEFNNLLKKLKNVSY